MFLQCTVDARQNIALLTSVKQTLNMSDMIIY